MEYVDINTGPVRMEKRRCFECGRWWAYETFHADTPECPVCAGKRIGQLVKKIERGERIATALRGALTRTKARRK